MLYGLLADNPVALMAFLRSIRIDGRPPIDPVANPGAPHLVTILLPCCPGITYFLNRPEDVPHSNLTCPHGNCYIAYKEPV